MPGGSTVSRHDRHATETVRAATAATAATVLVLLAFASTGCAGSDRGRFAAAYDAAVPGSEAPPHMVAAFGLDDAPRSGDVETALASVDLSD